MKLWFLIMFPGTVRNLPAIKDFAGFTGRMAGVNGVNGLLRNNGGTVYHREYCYRRILQCAA